MEVDVVSLASEFPNDNPALHHGVIWVCLEPTAPAQPCRSEWAGPDERGWQLAAEPEPIVMLEPPSTELIMCSVELESDEPLFPTVVAGAHESVEGVPLAELEAEEAGAIVVEELDPVEVSVEGVVPSSGGEPRDVDPRDESGGVLACERAEISEPPASEIVLAEPEPEIGLAPVFESIPPDESAAERIDSSALPAAPDDPFTVLVCTLADVAIQAGAPRVAAILPGLLLDGRMPEPIDPDLADVLRDAGVLDGTGVAASFVETASAWRAILRGTSDDFTACGAAMLDEWASDLLARMLCAPASAPMLRKELRMRGVAAFGLVEVAA
jgi:hypothetical protein